MDLAHTTALVTGANRGLGRSLVTALLDRGALKVYAAARDPRTIQVDDQRVVPIALDLRDADQIAAAAAAADDVDLLVNNAGKARFADPVAADRHAVIDEIMTNYIGTYDLVRAFVPALEKNGGTLVNVLSLLALASTPPMAGYSASKAALHSLTQALRPVLRARGVRVVGVYPGGIDTDMLAGFDAPKTPPGVVAENLLRALDTDAEDVFPDPTSQQMSAVWAQDPKAFERAFGGA